MANSTRSGPPGPETPRTSARIHELKEVAVPEPNHLHADGGNSQPATRHCAYRDGFLETDTGSPLPYGPTATPHGVNFSVFSHNASAVTLVLYKDDTGPSFAEVPLDPVRNRTGDLWHIRCGVHGDVRFSWRVDGPNDHFNRFDPQLALVDPYTRALSGGRVWGHPDVPRPDRGDAGVISPRRCRLAPSHYRWNGDRPLRLAMEDTIIYELHVRGFTVHPTAGVKFPGTFAGLREKIPYLRDLGITTVELLPVFEFDENENPRRDPATGQYLKNYWGYSPLAFFCPKASYAADSENAGAIAEFRDLVKDFHAAGIEVILDVVFNHTVEGNELGPTLSFKGFDNQVYYLLDNEGRYRNYSGCGNTVNCNHPVVRTFIIDVLHYWVAQMHVDGFRFDLASIMGRGADGNVLANPPVVERIAMDPLLADTKIIAEAWDAGGLNQVGIFPSYGRWAEWNGYYRDDLRRFWLGGEGMVSSLASRLCGSDDLYQKSGRKPYHSINFITAHDGFTLRDLVSYEKKRNEANGEGNTDGENHNLSCNMGVEGDTDDPATNARRLRRQKNLAASLLLSQGTPMLLAGDEFGRTQRGNNNAYCQDNEISWVDWSLADKNKELLRFFRLMIRFRKRHPALRRSRFFVGTADISWHGEKAFEPDWSVRSKWLAYLLDGDRNDDDHLFVIVNAADEARPFEVPSRGPEWRKVIDTSRPPPEDVWEDDHAAPSLGSHIHRLMAQPQSVTILVGKRR